MLSGERKSIVDPCYLRWRDNEFGARKRALYLMSLYTGEVQHVPNHPQKDGATWRVWAQTSADSAEIGWFQTEDDAKSALFNEVMRALNHMTIRAVPHNHILPMSGAFVEIDVIGSDHR